LSGQIAGVWRDQELGQAGERMSGRCSPWVGRSSSAGFHPAATDSGGRQCLTPAAAQGSTRAAAHDLARCGAGHERGPSPPIYRGGGGRAWRAQHACRGRRRLGQGGHGLKPCGLRWAQMGFGRPAAGPTEMRVGSGPRARPNPGIKILFFPKYFQCKTNSRNLLESV
jgi:hypothetical protein